MKALSFEDPSPVLLDLPVPTPGPREVLIRVYAAGVTPTELLWYPTTHAVDGTPRTHAVLGHEFSGVIESAGDQVTEFRAGEHVYGCNDWFANGATAEYCVASPDGIALKPKTLSHAEAAAVPIGALTAWQGLFDRANLQSGERVLIHGGAGAVGLFAVQLARRAGASIFTTASAKHAVYLQSLGAELVIDYHTERFEEHVREMDVVFDCVGGETLRRSLTVLKPNGRLVTIAADSKEETDPRGQTAFMLVEANQAQLIKIAGLLDEGELNVCLDGVLPLAQAAGAYLNKIERPLGRGKMVIRLDDEPAS